MSVPIFSWFDEPAKKSVKSVFDDLNSATEALDIFRKYRRNHFKRLKKSHRYIKILGMNQPVLLTNLYSPAIVSTTIYGRLYEQHWLSAENPETHPRFTQLIKRKLAVRADEYIENHLRVVILGSAGSGKTTLLRHLALSHCDRKIFNTTKLKTSKFPFFISLLSYAKELKKFNSI